MISQPQLTWQIKCKIGLTTCKMDVLILKCKSYCFYYFELWYQVAPLEMIIHPQKNPYEYKRCKPFFGYSILHILTLENPLPSCIFGIEARDVAIFSGQVTGMLSSAQLPWRQLCWVSSKQVSTLAQQMMKASCIWTFTETWNQKKFHFGIYFSCDINSFLT